MNLILGILSNSSKPYLILISRILDKNIRQNILPITLSALLYPRHSKSSAWLRLGEIHVPIFKPNLTCISYPPILTSSLGNGHTMLKAPVLVRSLKLSNIGPGQYLDGRPPGNTRCCCHFCTFVQFPHLQLPGVIRKGSPSIKVLKMEIFLNKISSSCCKWSNLNAPGPESSQVG